MSELFSVHKCVKTLIHFYYDFKRILIVQKYTDTHPDRRNKNILPYF